MDSIYSAANSASRAVFGESTADPNRAGQPTHVTDAATTDTTTRTDTNPFRGNVSTATADPFRHATDTGGSGTRHTGGSTYTAKPTTTTTSTFGKPSVGDLNKDGVRHNTSDTDRPFGAALRSEERPTISDTGILPPVHHQSAQKPLGAAGREHGGLSEMTGVSDTRQPHTTSTGIAHATPSTVTGEHHASNTRDRIHDQSGSDMPSAYDQHTHGHEQSGLGLSGTHGQQSHTHDRAHEQLGSGIPGAYGQHTQDHQQSGSGLTGSRLTGSGLTGQGLSGTHGQQSHTHDRAHEQLGSGIPGAYDQHTQDHQQSGSGLTGSGLTGSGLTGSGLTGQGLSGTHGQQSHTHDRAHEKSGSGIPGARDQHTQDHQQSGSGLTGSGLTDQGLSHTDDRTHEHEHEHEHSGTRDHQQSVSHEQQHSSSDLHTPSKSTPSTQPKPSTRIGPAIATLPTAPASTESGTGEKYEKSTGVAAEGGDFDASRPGAGREADRLLDQHGIHHGPEKKDVAAPEAGVPSHKKDMEHHEPAAHAEEEHKGLGEKIKEKLHLGHH